MDDLLGEDWKSAPKPASNNPLSRPPTQQPGFASTYRGFRDGARASPLSGAASPLDLSRPSSAVTGGQPKPASRPASRPATPANDAFGNLTGLKSQKPGAGLSIQERQRHVVEEKRRQLEEQGRLWENLGGQSLGKGGVEKAAPAVGVLLEEEEEDILAAFNKNAKVDTSSHFPPPGVVSETSGMSTPDAAVQLAWPRDSEASYGNGLEEDDDDPFGLNEAARKGNGHATAPAARKIAGDEDDILGDLGKPVSERRATERISDEPAHEWDENVGKARSRQAADEPADPSVAELVEMGFPADTAKLALAETGGDLQGAVGWLLQQAHEESRQKARREAQPAQRSPVRDVTSPAGRARRGEETMPSWMRQESRSTSGTRRQDGSIAASEGDKDAAQVAQDFGNKLFKSANSLWKASQKQVAKTMADFQQERDPAQPKWMQQSSNSGDSSRDSSQRRPDQRPRQGPASKASLTNEAALLDMPRDDLPVRPAKSTAAERWPDAPSRGRTPVEASPQRQPAPVKVAQRQAPQDNRPPTKLSRMEVEDQSAQAYVSPARRKRPTPKPEPPPEPEVDLFSPAPSKASAAASAPATAKTTAKAVVPIPKPAPSPRPQAPPRNVPSVSPAALSTSAMARRRGTEAFKRGDYAAAHDAYTAALSPLPATHPIAIVVLSNRALTALKTGDAKMAVSDADRALDIIGAGLGAGETIELGTGEAGKDMREFYGKAVMRKAEALEHMEKWADAAGAWRQAVSVGAGGAISLRGRDRCERAAAPATRAKPAVAAAVVRSQGSASGRAPPAKSMGNSLQRPTLTTPESAAAVQKLREANAAAERADDEKFLLSDRVEARLVAWKGGKTDNLRALLQSLDGVLWEGAGWKKVGMSDLVVAGKVKVVYMKAIAKVHPDKVSGVRVVAERRAWLTGLDRSRRTPARSSG